MSFKVKIVFFVLGCLTALNAQENWQEINTPVGARFYSIFALDTANIWIAADSGMILFTSDLGKNWEIQFTGNGLRVYDVYFINENEGWGIEWKEDAPPYGTYILKTTNGGKQWESVLYRTEDVFLHTIFFLDSLKGFSGGSNTQLIFSDDGGDNWYPADIDTSHQFGFLPVNKFRFFDDKLGFAVGGSIDIVGVIWRTSDAGDSWVPYGIGPDPIYDIAIFDSLNIYSLGGDFERLFKTLIIRSSDGGKSWEDEEIEIYGEQRAFSFRTPSEAWASMGLHENILVTRDSGKTWEYSSLPNGIFSWDIVFLDSLTGFIVCDSGKIFKYEPDSPTTAPNYPDDVVSSLQLFQNYPNPFNSTTTISFVIGNRSMVKIVVYDMLGREIKTLINQEMETGRHEIVLNTDDLSEGQGLTSGVYFYVMKVGEYILSKKLILLK